MSNLPYRIATLVYIFDGQGRLLLLRRSGTPNFNLYSPIGGKLEQASGESPYACALREVREEAGVQLELADLRLCGIVSERAFEGRGHWLIFCFESLRTVELSERNISEGRLEWVAPDAVAAKPIPNTDREIIWPLVRRHSAMLNHGGTHRREIFSVHIDCSRPGDDSLRITLESGETEWTATLNQQGRGHEVKTLK